MDFTFSDEARELRENLRKLISEHFDEGFLGAWSPDPEEFARTERFCRRLADEGLLTVAWPEEYGGRGASAWEQAVVREEMWAHYEPRGPQYMGVNWVGPTIMRYGSEAQRRQHLAAIGRGEVVWCQGFSEPEAGSDLAGLQTRAVADGDGWRIDGQKIWTSYAEWAQWCFLAARVGEGDRRQDGITIFLIPMDRPGIEVRPIRSMLGPHHLNEVFFDDVRAEDAEVLGEVGEGWDIIRGALANERVGIARYARSERLLRQAVEYLEDEERSLPPSLRARLLRALISTRINRLLAYRAISEEINGNLSPVEAAVARLGATRGDQVVADVLVEAIGTEALDGPGSTDPVLHGSLDENYRYSMAATVAAGTLEVQQMILARSIVGEA